MKSVLYTGAFRFPEGDAAAKRVFMIGRLFTENDYKVSFAGWEQHKAGCGHYTYEAHDCYPQSEFRVGNEGRLRRFVGFVFRGCRTLRWLWRRPHFDIVVAYNPPALFSLGLIAMSRVRRFILVLDNTEWYESSHLPGGRLGLAAAENWLRMKIAYPFFKNVICISRYLEQVYSGRNTILVYPLDDISDPKRLVKDLNEKMRFLYAGQPGKKDEILSFIKALPDIQTQVGKPVSLTIAGIDWSDFERLAAEHNVEANAYRHLVQCLGYLSKEHVKRLYQNHHFSILFRERKRYALAGFPTKAVESWAFGCPIIMNPVGDVSSLAVNMKTAIIVATEEVSETLPKQLQIIASSDLYERMQDHCIQLYKERFTIKANADKFTDFIASLR